MAVFALAVTKSVEWRGGTQPFSNVYHYVTQAGEPFDDDAAIDEVVAAERLVHTTDVTFQTARTWGPTSDTAGGGAIQPLNPASESVTRVIRDLTGTGSRAFDADCYKELAFLCVWPLGRYGTRNRPQYLRKWVHTMSIAGLTDGQKAGSDVIDPAGFAVITDYIADVRNVGPVEGYGLSTAAGREPISPGVMYDYLEHHQLGDQWRS